MNSKLILILYIILIMNLICHLHIFVASKNLYRIKTHHLQLTEFKVEDILATSFSHPIFRNFTEFNIIPQNKHQSLFVISQNDTIIEIETESMKMINNFTINACSHLMMPCQERIVINHLSEIFLLNHKMLWFCYVMHQQNCYNPSLTSCMVLKNKILTSDLKWQKVGYTSNSDEYKTFSIQTKDHIFIGSFVDNSLYIQRTKLPDIYGKIDSSKDLITPVANFYFEKNSKFLEVFETDSEIYFVVVEPVSAKGYSISDCLMSSDNRIVYVTRLVRICKKDEGGVTDHNEMNFGTIAKANLVCPIGTGEYEFLYKRAVSASWTNSKLYVLFENQKNSPPGKVVCFFDVFAFKSVFNGPIRPPWISLSSQKQEQNIKNPLPDVCEKLSSGLITENEKVIASSLSVNGLYRTNKIMPVTKIPIMHFLNKNAKQIKAFPTSAKDLSTILVIHYDVFIEIFTHTENNELCDISIYRLNNEEIVNQISGINFDNNIFVLISTNQRVIRLKINNCEQFLTKSKCLDEAPNICGWDSRTMTCSSLNDRIDEDRWQRSLCKHKTHNSVWSVPNICHVNDSQISLKCICKYCTDELRCRNKGKLEITNCSGTVEFGKWSEWEDWSSCSSETKLKTRKRKCLTKFPCMGEKEEAQSCYENSKNVFRSVWTQWYSVTNTNIYNSFRSKCIAENLGSVPAIEIREMVCENTCQENLFKWYKWSKWSDCTSQNVQYRLYNCSELSQCPANKIQIQNCDSISPLHSTEKDNNFGTIHIVLAVLVSSIIWVFILIFISIILLRMNIKPQKKRSNYRKRPNYLKRNFSVTSNDYLSSDLKSTICDADIMSLTHAENVAPISKHIPLITEQKFNMASI